MTHSRCGRDGCAPNAEVFRREALFIAWSCSLEKARAPLLPAGPCKQFVLVFSSLVSTIYSILVYQNRLYLYVRKLVSLAINILAGDQIVKQYTRLSLHNPGYNNIEYIFK